jgi:la-related protein 1
MDMETLKFYTRYQIEYYFSIENLCRDIFFRQQMNDGGLVALSLIASFNRVKALTTSMDIIKEVSLD